MFSSNSLRAQGQATSNAIVGKQRNAGSPNKSVMTMFSITHFWTSASWLIVIVIVIDSKYLAKAKTFLVIEILFRSRSVCRMAAQYPEKSTAPAVCPDVSVNNPVTNYHGSAALLLNVYGSLLRKRAFSRQQKRFRSRGQGYLSYTVLFCQRVIVGRR